MASKTISVTKEVYELLSKFKLPHESFGDAIKRLCEEKSAKSLYEWVQNRELWSDMSEEELKNLKRDHNKLEMKFTPHEVYLDDTSGY
jgi:predicted CopG family antitoxin